MKNIWILSVLLTAASLTGCNVGNAASGPSTDEMNNTYAHLPLDQKIAFINGSPDSPANKAKRIAEAKAQAGQK